VGAECGRGKTHAIVCGCGMRKGGEGEDMSLCVGAECGKEGEGGRHMSLCVGTECGREGEGGRRHTDLPAKK